MSWFKIDDKAAFHAKVIAAGNEAYGVWCRAGSWCSGQTESENTKDGFVPPHMAKTLCSKPSIWKRLVKVGLMETSDDGFIIHDYTKYNPTAIEVIERRRRESDKKALQRAKGVAQVSRGDVGQFAARVPSVSPRDNQRDTAGSPVVCPPLPVPSRPVPEEGRGETPVSEIQPRVDTELGNTFVSALLSAGYTVAQNKYAWRDLGEACVVYWPNVEARERHALLRSSVAEWVRGTDAKKSRGWNHNEWIRWANEGNVSAGVENRDAERAAKLEAQRAKTKAYLAAVKRVEAPQATHAAPESQRFHVDPAMEQDEAISG